nr:retrovirus-related Pol polyprotein from transposon TNT 1-94 [Tanacetum cinerariifolium]GEY15377.1 retrovirus-related Pol polyprotein from transposon TNT 1-94 [Tanacetum cinerariifolium]
ATIYNGRVTVQKIQGRQTRSFAGTGNRRNATNFRGTNAAGQIRVVKCYNCQEEWHMARQCTQPKRPRNNAWFKEKAMLAKAQESSQILDEEQLAFLADLGMDEAPITQQIIPQTKAVLMANLSSFDSNVLSEKRHNKTPYKLLHDRKPELSYLYVFGALCYPTNDGEDLGKLKPKADIGIFVGYAPAKKAFRIYNKRTRMVIETIHVDFDELTAMASEKFAIQAQHNNLGREIKKVNEKVYAAQVGCEQCKGPYYTKDFPLNEEGKTLKEAYYTQFGTPFQGEGYRATALGFYQRNNANPSYQEQRQSMEDTLSKFMSELEKRHEENSNLIKEM